MVEWRDHQEQPPSAALEPHIHDFLDLQPKTTLKSLLSLKRSTQKKREEAIKTISEQKITHFNRMPGANFEARSSKEKNKSWDSVFFKKKSQNFSSFV